MKPFQRRRLLKLAAFLEGMPRAKFDFNVIFVQGKKPPLEALAAGEHRCGTVGCAIGWLPAALPSVARWVCDTNFTVDSVALRGNAFRGNAEVTDFNAAAAAFGITQAEAYWLFSPGGSCGSFAGRETHNVFGRATPKQVAKHIRAFVEEYPRVGALRDELQASKRVEATP